MQTQLEQSCTTSTIHYTLSLAIDIHVLHIQYHDGRILLQVWPQWFLLSCYYIRSCFIHSILPQTGLYLETHVLLNCLYTMHGESGFLRSHNDILLLSIEPEACPHCFQSANSYTHCGSWFYIILKGVVHVKKGRK